jgi:hypothetical protein
MRSEDILFELKPCHECAHNCVEGQLGVKCPYDKLAEDLIYAEELAHIEMMKQRENENI